MSCAQRRKGDRLADDQDRALLDDLLARARRAGADGADAVYIRAQSQS